MQGGRILARREDLWASLMRFYSTDRDPMRGGQVLTTPRVCEASTSCVKLFMLA